MLVALGQLVAGIVVLSLGGHYLVRGAISIALQARVSTAIVGLTIVALGTSLPELAVCLSAAGRGVTDIAYANVAGSNIFNIAVILSVVALVRPVQVGAETLRFHYPVMFFALAAMVLLARDGLVDRLDGLFLIVGLAVFLGFAVRTARRERRAAALEVSEQEIREVGPIKGSPTRIWTLSLLFVLGGGVGLTVGADLIVRGAVAVADTLGVSERVIGLTIVAMGTSLPELAASAVAARVGHPGIAVSNLLGSNIFNVLGILGLTSTVFSVPVNPRATELDNWVMLVFAAVLFPMFWHGRRISRREASVLLVGFLVYVVVLMTRG